MDPADLATLEDRCRTILERKEEMAFDWAWEAGTDRADRAFRIVQASPSRHYPELADEPFRAWAIAFGSRLLGEPVEFWYDQFLAKPPEKGAGP